jgi:hypothetical protein
MCGLSDPLWAVFLQKVFPLNFVGRNEPKIEGKFGKRRGKEMKMEGNRGR